MRVTKRTTALLMFGMIDVAIGALLLLREEALTGGALVVIGLILIAAGWFQTSQPAGRADRAHFSGYAKSYALLGLAFGILTVVLVGVARSAASDGNTPKSWLAMLGAILAGMLAVASIASLVAAKRIAGGRAGSWERRWLPGWRLFIDGTNHHQD